MNESYFTNAHHLELLFIRYKKTIVKHNFLFTEKQYENITPISVQHEWDEYIEAKY